MSENKGFSMGGQALIEGVMMNAPTHYVASARREDKTIVSKIVEHHSKTEDSAFLALPVIRGAVRFVESLTMGMQALDFSADVFALEPEAKEGDAKKEKLAEGFAYAVGILLAVALFIILPVLLSRWLLKPYITSPWLLTVCEGVLRLILFFVYMLAISRIPDIRRTFEYHGAEHKTVACYEAGLALTVENARGMSRLNKRCGTSFIFIILIFSILLFMLIPVEKPLYRILLKLLLLPVMAGVSYEILKFSASSSSRLVNLLVAPGLWFQKITTREPDDEELEVALNSAIMILQVQGLSLPEGTVEIPHEMYEEPKKS